MCSQGPEKSKANRKGKQKHTKYTENVKSIFREDNMKQ